MRLTKADLMRLPKERLAEIIIEMQEEKSLTLTTPEKDVPHFVPYQEGRPYCWEIGGTCTNPQMDCINCPKHGHSTIYVHEGPTPPTYISGDSISVGNAKDVSAGHIYGVTETDGKEHNPSFTD